MRRARRKYKNGIRYPAGTAVSAVALRLSGKTHREIVEALGISLGTAHVWTKGIKMTKAQKEAIMARMYEKVFTPERREKLRQQSVRLASYREKHTRKELLDKIKNFYKEHGRIPMKREFNMHDVYIRRFRSWNDAIKSAGFSPNPILFAHKFIARDGHRCDSFTEKLIDDWFYAKSIHHERNIPYGKTKMTADFYINDSMVEFFGLAGVNKDYDRIVRKKKAFCAEKNIPLVSIYLADFFSGNTEASLNKVLKRLLP